MTSQPPPTGASPAASQELDATVKLAHELGHLKRLPRTGWLRAGVERPESIAGHTMRAAVLAWMIAGLEGADPERAATLALFHDSQESRTTDVDHIGRDYLHATSNEQITADQSAALPRSLAARLRALVSEYEGRSSLEADCARDADKLEMLLQAREYRQQGNANTEPFVQTALAPLRCRRPGIVIRQVCERAAHGVTHAAPCSCPILRRPRGLKIVRPRCAAGAPP